MDWKTDTVINKAVDVIYTMSQDEKIREAARMREKRRPSPLIPF